MYVRARDGLGQVTLPPGERPPASLPSSVTPRVLTYSTRDVIDKRISIPAQHALVRLSKNKNPATRAEAVEMLGAVKAGRLAGIYCVNWKAPAQRALRLGKSWWTVIPPGEDAILMLDPDNPSTGQPLIAFRRELDPDCGLITGEKRYAPFPSRLDAALLKAWTSYRLWQTGKVVPCGQLPGIPIHNVLPTGFCQPTGQTTLPDCPSPPTSSRAFTNWLQASLNRVLGTRLPVNGIFDAQTRGALRSFQRRKGLMPSGDMDQPTYQALVPAGAFSRPLPPCGFVPRPQPDASIIGVCCSEIKVVSVWVNAFIPGEQPGLTREMPVGPHAGKTVIDDTRVNCLLTDQRGFDSNPRALSRFQSRIDISLPSGASTQTHRTDRSTSLSCEKGTVFCSSRASSSSMRFSNLRRRKLKNFLEEIRVDLKIHYNDKCTVTPFVILLEGTLRINYDPQSLDFVTVAFAGKRRRFPAFEMYVSVNHNDKGAPIFTAMIPSGITLHSQPLRRFVAGSADLACTQAACDQPAALAAS